MSIAFIGGGNMAGALIGGLLAKGFDATQIAVVESADGARAKLAARHTNRQRVTNFHLGCVANNLVI